MRLIECVSLNVDTESMLWKEFEHKNRLTRSPFIEVIYYAKLALENIVERN